MNRVSLRAIVALLGLINCRAFAQTLWTENAENGLTYIIDGTDGDYPLIQSDIFAEGSNAFHLAHPNAQTNSFQIDQSITIQSDAKLFFQSRLGIATSDQIAKVQLSTNGGSTWPIEIYNQAGAGQPGEGAFGLKEIDLSPYANQSVNFRFLYDFSFGGYFPQTSPGVGWYIDDIQIGSELAKAQYSIGNPSADAQLYLEYINRARADALVEANRLANEVDADVTSSYNFFNIDPQDIPTQFQWYVNSGCIDNVAQPLTFNENLIEAAELHTQDMFNNQFQGHDSSSNPPAPFQPGWSSGQRATATGYSWIGLGENVFSHADSVRQGHAGFDVDWGDKTDFSDPCYNSDFAGQGMQNPAGHRLTIHNNDFKEIGIGVVNGTNGSVGPQLVTQDFGNPGSATFVTGIVFEDLDGDSFYDIGEGRSGVRIDVDGSGFFALSSDSGGYAVPVSGDGSYDVSFTGGGFADFMTIATVSGGDNVKIDYLATTASFDPADFDESGTVDGLDLAQWERDFGLNGNSDADDDGDTDGADFLAWQRALSGTSISAVPEPSALLLAALAVSLLSRRSTTGRVRAV